MYVEHRKGKQKSRISDYKYVKSWKFPYANPFCLGNAPSCLYACREMWGKSVSAPAPWRCSMRLVVQIYGMLGLTAAWHHSSKGRSAPIDRTLSPTHPTANYWLFYLDISHYCCNLKNTGMFRQLSTKCGTITFKEGCHMMTCFNFYLLHMGSILPPPHVVKVMFS